MSIARAELQLFIYTGLSSNVPSSPQYSLTKERVIGSGVTFEIGELVRDYLEHTFDNNYMSSTLWVKTSTKLFDDNDVELSGSPNIEYFIAKDGYGDFEDAINPQLSTDLLQSNTIIYLPKGVSGKLPIFSEGVGSVKINGSTTVVSDNGNSNQKIQYITIPADSQSIQVKDRNNTIIHTLRVVLVDCSKHEYYKVTFVNKFGAYQDFWFFGKTTESININDTKFKTNTINVDSVSFPTNLAQEQRSRVQAKRSLVLNSGFIDENLNNTIEQLLLSEQVWIRYKNKTLAVNPTESSFKPKTHLNEKLINYTINFDFAFDRFNTVL